MHAYEQGLINAKTNKQTNDSIELTEEAKRHQQN